MVSDQSVAILPGRRCSFLDHLIPICHIMDMPLVCTDRWIYTLAEHFYPKTQLLFATMDNFQEILSNYQTFYTVEPCRLHPYALKFGEFIYRGKAKTINGLHGNPDKYRQEYWIERYTDEDIMLIYGQHVIDYLKEKGVWQRLGQTIQIGNIRLPFYQIHKPFFDQIIEPHLFVKNDCKTVLYAPTWSFSQPSVFFETYPYVLDNIPDEFQVIVKPHPYSFHLFPEKINQIKHQYADNDKILFLDEIPLIYPFLARADIYLGDYSSVGYDFLALNKPLYFLGSEKRGLQECGVVIDKYDQLYQIMAQKDRYPRKRQKLYEYAYSRSQSFTEIRSKIEKFLTLCTGQFFRGR